MRLDLDPSNQSLIRNGLSGRAAVRKLHLRRETRLRMPNYKRTGLKTSGSRSYGVMNPTLFTILTSVKMWRHFIEGSGFSLHNLIQSAALFSLKKKRRIKLTEIHIFFIMRETECVSVITWLYLQTWWLAFLASCCSQDQSKLIMMHTDNKTEQTWSLEKY